MSYDNAYSISNLISAYLEENPQDANILFAAMSDGMIRSVEKSRRHASQCQYAVSAIAALSSPDRLSSSAKELISDFLINSLPYIDNTEATKKLVEKLGDKK